MEDQIVFPCHNLWIKYVSFSSIALAIAVLSSKPNSYDLEIAEFI